MLQKIARVALGAVCATAFLAGSAVNAQETPNNTGVNDRIAIFKQADKVGKSIKSLDDTSRFLLLMGALDGLSAAHDSKAPCFAGMNNSDIVSKINDRGKGESDVVEMSEILINISNSCPGSTNRGYTAELFKTMTNEMLADYINGVMRSWVVTGICQENRAQLAADVGIAFLLQSENGDNPVQRLKLSLADSCLKADGRADEQAAEKK